MRRCTVFCMILLLCSLLFVPVSAQTAEYDGYLVKLSEDAPRLFSRGGLEDFLLVDTLEEALELPEEYVEYIEPNYWIYLFDPVMDGDGTTSADPETDTPADPGTGGSTTGESVGGDLPPVPPEEETEVPVWPDDPLYEEEQWGLQAVNGLAACETGYTGGSVLVGMVDSGAHAAHEDLNAANITGENYVDDGLPYSDDIYGHGTVVAGVISAQTDNGVGIAGIAPDVQLRAYRCFNSKAATVREVIPGILQAIEDGCQVLNLSLGTPYDINAIREAVEAAQDAGIVVVAAVGNDGTTTLQYPAAYPGVIGVGAVNTALDVASFSQQNESVFVTAPGEALIGLDYEDAQGYLGGLRGTSYAAPFVTAMAAAALDYDADLTAEGIRYLLQTTSVDLGDPGYDTEYGWGLVDLEAFLEELQREFSITYELNGGTLSGQAHEHYFVTDQDLALPEVARAGYHFTGWYTDEELQQPVEEIPAGSVGDKTFYAGWKAEHPMELLFDDRLDLAGKAVEILDAGTPTSYQVGHGVAENTVLDTAVVTLEGDTLIATGIGIAVVKIDGVIYEITVETAPLSLLLLIGQNNMEGNEGDANQSIVCPDGQVYATYGDRYDMDITNATHYAPSALTGAYREINGVGTADGLADYPVYMLTDEGTGRKGPDSGFAYEWIRQTGEKVWIVNASHGGTSIDVWQPGTTQYEECQTMFGACTETLRKEIAAGHFTLSHMAYFWCQGCNDWGKSAEWYVDKYLTMHEALKTELAFDHDSNPATEDKTFEFGGIIPVRAGHELRTCYRTGTYTDTTDQSYYESFMDLQMAGPRVAQYWMGNHPELTDIWNVCTIGEDWVWMPDGTNGVSDYFNKHYTGGRVDYETQTPQTDSWYTPTTPKDVHDSIHYNQIGYNEVGREAVRNALVLMGINEDYEEETTVTFVDWTGYREADEVFAFAQPHSYTLVVPIVRPVTRCKTVNYSLTDGLYYDWYDLTAKTYDTTGTLSAVGAEGVVMVSMQPPGTLFADHLNTLPTQICRGLNLWPLLEHDSQYYTVNGWGKHASNQVFSVTVPVQAGDQIWATSMGANDVNGNTVSTGNGIRVTFFSEYEVLRSMTSNAVYAEFSANGYLTAPEGAVAVNVPMWNNDDSNELYLMSRAHDETAPICSICGKSSHTHSWSAWEIVSLPTAEAAGLEQRSCSCGETENREVEGVWQKYALSEHLIPLPESVCCGLNLWSVLEHEEEYYYSGTHWGINASTAVQSITIPVSEGERIFATSFGKAGENGHPTSNGIRVTFFDVYGVCKTMSPAETYAEFAANGWLTAPAGTIAVNIPVYADAEEIEVYLTDREHCYGTWMTVSEPTCSTEGQDQRSCICGNTQYRDTRISGSAHKILVSQPLTEDFFAGKTIMAVGDSLTNGTGVTKEQRYQELVGQALDMTVINRGTSGATLCPGGHLPNKFEDLMDAELLAQQNVDIVTIFLGVNDWNNGVVNGTIRGELKYDPALTYYDLGEFGTDDTTTVYGAMKMWCERILELQATEACKDVQFIFATPVILQRNRSVTMEDDWRQDKTNVFGYTLRQYCTAIMEVCAYYEIPVLDLNLYSGMYYHSEQDHNVDYFGGDGIHPGVNGHAMMAAAFTEFLLDNYSYEARELTDCGHSYENTVTEPTCTAGGYETFHCPVCYYSYQARWTAPLEHTYDAVLTPPTCENGGYTAYTCTACGDSYSGDFTEALEHSFTDYSRYDPEACAEVAVCDHGCGTTDSRPIHSEPQWTWSPEGVTGEDYGAGRLLLALFDEHHQMLEADFCSSVAYTVVGETVIFRYEPPEFSREALEKADCIVRFSLDLEDRFAPIMRALTFD